MLFSEPLKAIPKRWMHFRTTNILFRGVGDAGIQGMGHLQLKLDSLGA